MVVEKDPRFISILRSLHKLRISIPTSLSEMPTSLAHEIEAPKITKYLSGNGFVEDSKKEGDELYEYRTEKDKYTSEVVQLCDSLDKIVNNQNREPAEIRNAWKHLWDEKRKKEYQDKLQKNLKYYKNTSKWTIKEWFKFVVEVLSKVSKIPDVAKSVELLMRKTAQFGVTENAINSSKAEVKAGLEAMGWNSYVEVKDKTSGKKAIQALRDLLLRYNVVEISGEGGLGKTELFYQFLRNQLDGDYDTDLPSFEHYIILTAKSELQGEVNPEGKAPLGKKLAKSSPLDKSKGPRTYISRLDFNDVIRIINSYDTDCHDLNDVENAKEVLDTESVLLALDNFEDCSEEDVKKFQDFFNDPLITRMRDSRIVVTGRSRQISSHEIGMGIHNIELQKLAPLEASKLFEYRYFYLWELANKNKLTEIDWKGREPILTGLRDGEFPQKFEKFCQQNQFSEFKRMMGHPYFIFHMTVLIGDQNLLTKHYQQNTNFELIGLISRFVTDDELDLNSYHEELYKWIIGKAYSNVEKDKVAMLILEKLFEYSILSVTQLKDFVSQAEYDKVDDYDKAIARIQKHEIFMKKSKKDGETAWELRPDGRKYLENKDDFYNTDYNSQTSLPSEVSLSIVDDLNSIYDAIEIGSSDLSTKIGLLKQELSISPLHKRKKPSFRIYIVLAEISRKINDTEVLENWEFIHNQAINALFISVTKDKEIVGASKPKLLKILFRLMVESELTSEELLWKILTEKGSFLWFENKSTRDGNSELFRHKLIQLLNSDRDNLQDWVKWCAFYGKMIPNIPLGKSWLRLKKILLLDEIKLENFIKKERIGKTNGYLYNQAAEFIASSAIYDEEWDQGSYNLLRIFDSIPTESNFENLASWKKYTKPPLIPEQLRIIPENWLPPQGLSFDWYGFKAPEFKEVDEYDSYRNNPLGRVMDDGPAETNDDEPLNQKRLADLEHSFFTWLEKQTSEIAKLNKLPEFLQDEISPETGVNSYLSRISNGKYNSLKIWLQNYLIHQEKFLKDFEYSSNANLGSIKKKNFVKPSQRKPNPNLVIANKEKIWDTFYNDKPCFPGKEDALGIIKLYPRFLLDSKKSSLDRKINAKNFKSFCKKNGFSTTTHGNLTFGFALELSEIEEITIQNVLQSIRKTGRHRIGKSDSHRVSELNSALEEYLKDIEKSLEEGSTIFPLQNPNRTLTIEEIIKQIGIDIPSPIKKKPVKKTKTKAPPPARNISAKNPERILKQLAETCFNRFPDTDVEKHLKSAGKKLGIKIKSANKFLDERDDLDISLKNLETYLEDCKFNGEKPTVEQALIEMKNR